MLPSPDATIEELAHNAYLEAKKTAIVKEISLEETGAEKAIKEFFDSLKEKGLILTGLNDDLEEKEEPKFYLNRESSIYINNLSVPNYQEIEQPLLSKSIEIEPGIYEYKVTGLSFYPRPSWFSSDSEINEISSIIENLPSYNSLDDLMSEFKENSFHGKIWALSNLSALLFYYNYDYTDNRNYEEPITENQSFEALKTAYSSGEKIPIIKCADVTYFSTKAGGKIGLDVCEVNAAYSNNEGAHAIFLVYDKEYGYVIIDGTGKREIIFTNTHNRELAEKIYQKEKGSVKFINEVYQGDKGALLLELADEGKLIAKAWEYDESPKNFKEKLLRQGKKNISTGVSIEESNQYFFVRPQIGNLFFKGGYIQGDELSTLKKGDFALAGLELSGKITDIKPLAEFLDVYTNLKSVAEFIGIHADFKTTAGFVNINTENESYLDCIISLELALKRNVKITDKYSITPGVSIEYLGGGWLDEKIFDNLIKYSVSSENIYLGISDELQLTNALKLNTYVFDQIKIDSRAFNQQFPLILIPYSFHVGQKWTSEKSRKKLTLNPEFFIAKPEYGGSLGFSLDLNNKFGMSLDGSYSKSLIQPFNADKIDLNGRISVKPNTCLEIYLKGNYSKEFWPVTPEEKYSIKIGTKYKIP